MRFLLFKQITFKLGNCSAVNPLSRRLRWSGGGGLNREGVDLFERGTYLMVLILYKELEKGKLRHMKLDVMQPRIINKSELPVGE